MTNAFTSLEQDVLSWIAARSAPRLARQLRAARFAGRQHSGVGSFVDLEVLPELASPCFLSSGRPVNGPDVKAPALDHGAGTIVFFEQGRPCCLELFTYHGPFPKELDGYALQAVDLTSEARLKYDEDEEIVRSILHHQAELLTDVERQALRALRVSVKAKHTDSEPIRRMLIAHWGNRGVPEVDEALDQGYDTFSIAVVRRVLHEVPDRVVLNRCPRCDRIPRTPRAKQCPWCFHDWRRA